MNVYNINWLPDYKKWESSWSYVWKLIKKNKLKFLLFLFYILIINDVNFFTSDLNKKIMSIEIDNIKLRASKNISDSQLNLIIFLTKFTFTPFVFTLRGIFFWTLEELIFRKLFKWIFRRKKIWKWISLATFVLIHYNNYSKGIFCLSLIPISFILTETYDKTDNIWIPIIIHSLYNLISLIFFLLRF